MKPASFTNLYSRPKFRNETLKWFDNFNEALLNSSRMPALDYSSVLSMISFHHTCENSTLIKEIRQNRWLSESLPDGSENIAEIPKHGLIFEKPKVVASKLFELLVKELAERCSSQDKLYLLLSGGLDSRVVACALREGINRGIITSGITAVTWGFTDSVDVTIAKKVAEELNFDWINIGMDANTILKNIRIAACELGSMTTAYHLHSMPWFENVPKNSLVIAGSFGDGIGRAEYSGRHILELDYYNPLNRFNLIKEEYFYALKSELAEQLKYLRLRYNWNYKYELCEAEMQCHYMRNLIGYSMNVINNYCSLYQAFTNREIVSYIWSLHPSVRNNSVYAAILQNCGNRLSALPWARTKKALKGRTISLDQGLRKSFHAYRRWISSELYDELYALIDFRFLSDLEIFDMGNVQKLCRYISDENDNYHAYNLYLWLISFSVFKDHLKKNNIELSFLPETLSVKHYDNSRRNQSIIAQKKLSKSKSFLPENLKMSVKKLKKLSLMAFYVIKYPPRLLKNNRAT